LQAFPNTDYYMPVDAFDIMKTTNPEHNARQSCRCSRPIYRNTCFVA
jgi:hypothetical protein